MTSTEYAGGNAFKEEQLETAIIELFLELDYTYVNGQHIQRDAEEFLLREDLEGFLSKRYEDKGLTSVELQKIVQNIDLVPAVPLYEGNRNTFRLVTEGFDFSRDDPSKAAFHVDFIDFDNPENNVFKIVNQLSVRGERLRRPDVLIFVNGIPVTILEFKSAIEENTTVHDAWEQITMRYTRDIAGLLKYTFLAIISDGANTRMGSIFSPYEYFYSWNKITEAQNTRDGISALLTLIHGAFTKTRLLAILRDFVFYPDDHSSSQKTIVARYPQFFAANSMLASIKKNMRPAGDGKGGTYFGATGSGKTFTMLFLTRMLALRDPETFKNPTVIILVDREDLSSQVSELFASASQFLHENDVRSIESRADLHQTLKNKPSGGVYITTIQKFCESTGLLSDRNNIICISDEAHRTQTGIGPRLRQTDQGVFVTYGLAKYLREAFPNATYCGVTGTPIDETIAVFGDIVDSYTMREATEDGITVRIAYEPRLARIAVSEEKAKEIQDYYDQASILGATDTAIEESQRAMSAMRQIIADQDRLVRVAADIVQHYEALCLERPAITQKAMIVCMDRDIAFRLVKELLDLRPSWAEVRKSEDDSKLTREELDDLVALPQVNLVVTQGADDPPDLYEMAGNKDHRKMLDKQFKHPASNFKIAVVVDMWITGFDVPSLAVMYLDKPVQKHSLIQTISRVNRVYEGKDRGLVVDYIGIRKQMLQALKAYGNEQESPVDEISLALKVVRNQLSILDNLFSGFDSSSFHDGSPLERLKTLNEATEFIQRSAHVQQRFMNQSKRLKAAYTICFPTGELNFKEVTEAQFYMAVRSILYKQTKGTAPDAERMNRVVESMVAEAIHATGIESIVDENKSIDLFSDETLEELKRVELPITKFNALTKLLETSIKLYRKTNKIKSLEFDERLKKVVETFNSRDDLTFTTDVINDFVNGLTEQLIIILRDLQEEQNSFETLGIDYQEKAFYDVLIKVRDTHQFAYSDEKCVTLAKKIKALIDDKSQYADWSTRADIKSQLARDLTLLLYENDYPPQWNEEVFEQVMEQAENFKKHGE